MLDRITDLYYNVTDFMYSRQEHSDSMKIYDLFLSPYDMEVITRIPSVEGMARKLYRSPSQLARDFYAATGYSVHEYQRHLRLSKALCYIKTSQMSLAEISYLCGYSSQQALCREIRSYLHMTATEYRESDSYYFLSVYDKEIPWLTEVLKVKIPQTVCLPFYHPVLQGLESLTVQTFLNANPSYNGRIFGRNGTQYRNRFCYELYVEDTGELNTDVFSSSMIRPAYSTTCAQIRVRNSEEKINAAWDWLYSVWLPKSMFAYAGVAESSFENEYFEEYIYRNGQVSRLKLYLPVVKRKDCLRVTLEETSLTVLAANKTGVSAEKEASHAVLDYLSKRIPGILHICKQFYYREDGYRFTCGVLVDAAVPWNGENYILRYENTPFAILHLPGIVGYAEGAEMLAAWVRENGVIPDGEIFAVYDCSDSCEDPSMKLYCPIRKLTEFDNTSGEKYSIIPVSL